MSWSEAKVAGCALASLLLDDRNASLVREALPAREHARIAAKLSTLGEGAAKRRAVRALAERVRPVVTHESDPRVLAVLGVVEPARRKTTATLRPGYAPDPALAHALRRIVGRRAGEDDSP